MHPEGGSRPQVWDAVLAIMRPRGMDEVKFSSLAFSQTNIAVLVVGHALDETGARQIRCKFVNKVNISGISLKP